jgi:hypothetical protein
MKNALYILLFVLILGNLCHFGLPWWALAPLAAVAGWLFPVASGKTFLAAFAGGLLLWWFNAYLLDAANDGLLSAKVGQLFQGLKGWQLMLVTGIFGGLLAGLGGLTGLFARAAFVGDKAQR